MNLFLDDERFPGRDAARKEWKIARSVGEAIELCQEFGCPKFVAFDHDLGPNEQTGYDFAKWLVDRDLDKDGQFIPDGFEFEVHSMNPVGAKNIRNLLEQYLGQK